jgi:predicted restriction endonuclease
MSISKEKRRTIVESQNHRCAFCGCPIHLAMHGINLKDAIATMDHIIPQVDGGTDELDNLVGACQGCNSLRGSMEIMEFYSIIIQSDADYRRDNAEFFKSNSKIPCYFHGYNRARKRYRRYFPLAA